MNAQEHNTPAPLLFPSRATCVMLGGITERTLFNLRERDELPCVKIGSRVFFDRRDIELFIARAEEPEQRVILSADATTTAAQISDFASALYLPDDVVEIRQLRKGGGARSSWHKAADLPSLAPQLQRDNAAGWNIYFGVNPRRSIGLKGDKSIDLARVVFAEFDHITEAEVIERLGKSGLPAPTMMLWSGHGVWVFWLLSEPMIDLTAWTELQRDLAAHLDSDPVVCNPERIARAPAFINHKPPVADSKIICCDATITHDFTVMVERTPARPEKIKSAENDEAVLVDVAVAAHKRKAAANNNGSTSVIDAFNNNYDIAGILLSKGYKPGRAGKLIRPGGETPSVNIFDGRSIHFSSDDPLCDGKVIASAGCHDCFDIFCLLDHRGDMRAAVRAAAVELGIEHKKSEPAEKPGDLPAPLEILKAVDLCRAHTELREPLIDGLLRKTELMMLVSAAKAGKTYLAISLAFCLATGRAWLSRFPVRQGRVLYLDAELHPQTFARRMAAIASAMGITLSEIEERFDVVSLRGKLRNTDQLDSFIRSIPKGKYTAIFIDAIYRFYPERFDENNNADWTALMNRLDRWCEITGASIIAVHHSSKGNQSGKSVVDVGSGGSAQARCPDTHCIIRAHEVDGAAVLEAATRSWPSPKAVAIRWVYPVWVLADDLDPGDLKQPGSRRKRQDAEPEPQPEPWGVDRFITAFATAAGQEKALIVAKARQAGLGLRQVDDLIRLALDDGKLHRWHRPKTTTIYLSTIAQPITETGAKS